MRVLLTAYSHNAEGTSESLSASKLSEAIGGYVRDVSIITRQHERHNNNTKIIQVPCSRLAKGSRLLGGYKYGYYEFIARAYARVRRNIEKYDLIHHISPISLRYPNPLCGLGLPFIWGPIGGSIPYPPGFAEIGREDKVIHRLRRMDRIRLALDPMLRKTIRKSSFIVVTSNATRQIMPASCRDKVAVIPEGIDIKDIDLNKSALRRPDFDYIFSSGRLVPYKAMDLLIKAFAKVPSRGAGQDVRLLMTGDGPQRQQLERLIRSLGVSDRVTLLGRVPKSENLAYMQHSLFCVFPALNEACGHVNLEAMAASKPVIGTNWGGPADIVEEGITGFKVLEGNVEDQILALARKMTVLLENGGLRNEMGRNASRRVVDKFSWGAIAQRYSALYDAVSVDPRGVPADDGSHPAAARSVSRVDSPHSIDVRSG